ncbi:phosphoglycerate mutase family protein [Myxococcota bacterium]|nr:phosphoglycerate mutase family protein [Myxococcota bacterium]
MSLRRLVLVRHGESEGNSQQRLIGSGDPSLSKAGRDHMRAARAQLAGQVIDAVVASPARRSWQSAQVLTGGAPIRLEADFREIHFGRWEGRKVEDLAASDPALYQQWREGAPGFEYPGGELRAQFRERVERGLARLMESGATSALLVVHKGVIRTIVEALLGQPLEDRDRPVLGESLILTRVRDGWVIGSRSSNPPGIPTPAPIEPAEAA